MSSMKKIIIGLFTGTLLMAGYNGVANSPCTIKDLGPSKHCAGEGKLCVLLRNILRTYY